MSHPPAATLSIVQTRPKLTARLRSDVTGSVFDISEGGGAMKSGWASIRRRPSSTRSTGSPIWLSMTTSSSGDKLSVVSTLPKREDKRERRPREVRAPRDAGSSAIRARSASQDELIDLILLPRAKLERVHDHQGVQPVRQHLIGLGDLFDLKTAGHLPKNIGILWGEDRVPSCSLNR